MWKKLRLGEGDSDAPDSLTTSQFADQCDQFKLTTCTEKMKYILETHALSDVTLVVGLEEVEIPAHRLILSLNSPVFEAIFSERWNSGTKTRNRGEKTSEDDCKSKKEIYLPDLEENAVKYFLNYIYTDVFDFPIEFGVKVIQVARYFGNQILDSKCQEYLETKIDGTNALQVYQETQESEDFRESSTALNCLEYVLFHASTLVSSVAFLSLSQAGIYTLVSHDRLNIDETSLFDAVIRWAKFQCNTLELEVSGSNIRHVVGEEVLHMIRFPLLSSLKVTLDIADQEILKDFELIATYKAISFIENPAKPMPMTDDIQKFGVGNPFLTTPRSRIHILSRNKTPKFNKAPTEYCKSWHKFFFVINSEIRIVGVGMYTYNPGPVEYDVTVILHDVLNDTQLDSVRKKLSSSESQSSISPILFHTALLISPAEYEILFKITVTKSGALDSEELVGGPPFFSPTSGTYSKSVKASMNEKSVQFDFVDKAEIFFTTKPPTAPFPEIYFVFM